MVIDAYAHSSALHIAATVRGSRSGVKCVRLLTVLALVSIPPSRYTIEWTLQNPISRPIAALAETMKHISRTILHRQLTLRLQ